MNGMLDETYAQTVAVLPAYARGMAGRLAALWAPSGQPAESTPPMIICAESGQPCPLHASSSSARSQTARNMAGVAVCAAELRVLQC